MKILHICWSLDNGGAENMLVDIINYQVKHEDVSLFIVNDRIDYSIFNRLDKRCHVKRMGRKEGDKNPFSLLNIYSYLLFHHFDIVHLHNSDMIKYLWLKRNYVRTVHNTNISIQNYRWHKGIIAISESVKEDLESRGIHRSVVIDNGINFSLIKPNMRKKKNEVFRMIQVSRIYFGQKGQDILVEAVKKVLSHGITNIHLDFIGTGQDIDRLKQMIKDNRLEEYISLLGNKPREYIYEHLCDYDLFVQPSRFEGFGLTVAEAMGAKIPVLVSENEGPLAIIENGKYGFTFKNMSVDDCAWQIEKIMKEYPSKDFLESVYRHVHTLYNVDNTAQGYLDFYQKILRNS